MNFTNFITKLKNEGGQGLLFLIIGVIVAASFLLVNGLPSTKLEKFGTSNQRAILQPTSPGANNSLQLQTPPHITITPTPTPTLTETPPPTTVCDVPIVIQEAKATPYKVNN